MSHYPLLKKVHKHKMRYACYIGLWLGRYVFSSSLILHITEVSPQEFHLAQWKGVLLLFLWDTCLSTLSATPHVQEKLLN